MIRINIDAITSLSIAAFVSIYTMVILAALIGTNGAMLGQLIV